MIKAALIGCGGISSLHFMALDMLENVKIIAVCDIKPEKTQKYKDLYSCSAYTDYKEMIDTEKPEVVHICTPHYLHMPMAVFCLERNINVVLEKPLATSLEDGQKIIDAAKKSSGKIAISFQNRYNNTSQNLKRLVSSGSLGKLLGARAFVTWNRTKEYYVDSGWRGTWKTEGGGVLINQSIHTLDLIQWLLGDITEIKGNAQTDRLRGVIEVEDTANIYLSFSNGARCVFYATVCHVEDSPVFIEIIGDKGKATLLGNNLSVDYKDGTKEFFNNENIQTGEKGYWGNAHLALIKDFYSGLNDGKSFWIDPQEAMKTLKIIMDIHSQSGISKE